MLVGISEHPRFRNACLMDVSAYLGLPQNVETATELARQGRMGREALDMKVPRGGLVKLLDGA